jgi:lysosomal acid phosphatase
LISIGFCQDKLVFVQAVWRHGDRSPTKTFPSDRYQEDDWPQGWGQLTEWGMRQHIDLGQKLRKRYVEDLEFLRPDYHNHEIYVRSTDVNRTMISAMSNMLAMYPGAANASGFSYPNIDEWPTYTVNGTQVGYVPIAIHTINDNYDFTLNADMVCPRQKALWKIVEQTPEYIAKTTEKKDLLNNLTQITGMNVTLSNLWIIADALFIERIWNKTWIDGIEAMFNEINETNDLVEYWNNGLKLNKFQGIDFSIEIPKIRGGSLLWSIIEHMQMKLSCLKDSGQDFCPFFNRLKYYVYSAHDTTLAALFSTLKLPYTNLNEDGYPHYSSCVAVELWQKPDGSDYVKFVYFPLDPVDNTGHLQEDLDIPDCHGTCTVESLYKRSLPFKPLPSAYELCATLPPTTSPKPPIKSTVTYKVVAQRLSNEPIISQKLGSYWKYNYNAAVFTKDGKVGLVVRVQNLLNDSVPFVPTSSHLAVSTLTFSTDGKVTATQTTNVTTPLMLPAEMGGTEDPRITYKDGIYYLFYTAYDGHQAMLSSAISGDPFDSNSWIRFSDVDLPSRSWSKSGAALFASADNGLDQDYLFWGDSSTPSGGIGIATGKMGKWSWYDTGNFLIKTRNESFDSNLVESGPTPLKLNTGDYLFIYNSARAGYPSVKPEGNGVWQLQYNIGYAILAGTDPTQVLQRSDQPILCPDLEWEIGNSTDYLTPNVVFLEGLIPDPNGCKYANVSGLLGNEYVANAECFFGVYGGADSFLGAVQIIVSSNTTNTNTPSSSSSQPPSSSQPTTPPSSSQPTTPSSASLQSLSFVVLFFILFLTL